MELKRAASAGTMESSDIMVTIAPSDEEGIEIELSSSVEKQFGRQIRNVITTVITEAGIESAYVQAVDKGALDCTIRARVRAALDRASKEV